MNANPLRGWLHDLLGLPWRRYRLTTRLAPAAAIAAVRDATEARRVFRMPFSTSRTFEGVVDDDGFRISRIIRYRNSLRPLIIGRVEPAADGTQIEIVMRPDWFAMGAVVFILAVSITIAILIETAFRAMPGGRAFPLSIIVAILVSSYVMISIPFGLEARWAREILRTLLDAEIVSPMAAASPAPVIPRGYAPPLPVRTPYLSAEQWRRQRVIRRAFIAYFLVVFTISVGAFSFFSLAWSSAARHPEGPRTAALVNHGITLYVTPHLKFMVDLLRRLMLFGIITVMAGGLIIDRLLGVPLFSNSPRHPNWRP